MPAKRKTAKSKGAANAAVKQLNELRKTVKDLRTRLEREIKAHKIEARLREGANRAQKQLSSQLKSLRNQGRKVAAELRSALGRSNNLENARKEAHKMAARLRKELSQRTAELRHKSAQLSKLAEQSAHRAMDIIRGEEPHAPRHAVHAPAQPAVSSAPPAAPAAIPPEVPSSGGGEEPGGIS